VQLPELTDNPQFPTIAEIAKERIRRVAARLKAESTAQLPLADAAPPDLGFRVLRVADSHFKRWADVAANADDAAYQLALEDAVDSPLRPGWTHAGLLTEILLQEGFPLDADVERLSDLPDADVRRVRRESSPHALFVCLDERILARTVDALPLTPQDSFLCFDAALSDEAKLRLADRCRLKTF
jgi:adenine-specific DNA-methyltransferase